jgi:hypothetical protein
LHRGQSTCGYPGDEAGPVYGSVAVRRRIVAWSIGPAQYRESNSLGPRSGRGPLFKGATALGRIAGRIGRSYNHAVSDGCAWPLDGRQSGHCRNLLIRCALCSLVSTAAGGPHRRPELARRMHLSVRR